MLYLMVSAYRVGYESTGARVGHAVHRSQGPDELAACGRTVAADVAGDQDFPPAENPCRTCEAVLDRQEQEMREAGQ